MKVTWEDNEVLVKWSSKSSRQCFIKSGPSIGKGLSLAQHGLLTILTQKESEVAMGQRPSILAAEIQRAHLWKTYGPLQLSKFSEGTCNLLWCTMTAFIPRIDQNKTYLVVQLVGLGNILNTTCFLSVERMWTPLYNSTQWKPVSVQGF